MPDTILETNPVATSGGNLLEKSVLVSLKLGRYGTTRKVSEAAQDVADKECADVSKINVTKRLLDSDELKAITKLDGEIRSSVYAATLPAFSQDGIYVLPIASIDTFDAKITAYLEQRKALVAAAAAALPSLIADDAAKLGRLHNPADYPATSEFQEAFTMSWRYLSLNVPAALKGTKYFDVEAAKEQAANMDMEAGIRRWMREGFYGVAVKIAERLDGTRENGKVKIFRDSLVTNMNEYIDSFAAKNLTGDAELAALVAEAQSLLEGITAEQLRADSELRTNMAAGFKSLAAQAQALLNA